MYNYCTPDWPDYGGGGGSSGTTTIDCPTSAACGCSNKNKDECFGPCCQWYVGEGCNCAKGAVIR